MSLRSEFDRHDTPTWMSEALVRSLPSSSPSSVVDLGAGGGSLALAALRRWKTSRLVTVDVDISSAREVAVNLSHARERHRHVIADALSPGLIEKAGVQAGSVDIVLANPPYRTAKWQTEFGTILTRAGLSRDVISYSAITPDLIFLAQALYLVKPSGRLGLILPDTLVSGQRASALRQHLSQRHTIERVIQLPRRAFEGTDAQAYIMILRAAPSDCSILLERVHSDGTWSPPVSLPKSSAFKRLDHDFHDSMASVATFGLVPIRDLGVTVARGRVSSPQVRAGGQRYFHTDRFPKRTGDVINLVGEQVTEAPGHIVACEGDIVLARVDRRLESKIGIIERGTAILSDCVFRLRCAPQLRERVLRGLCNVSGQGQLVACARGVGARSLTMADVLNIKV